MDLRGSLLACLLAVPVLVASGRAGAGTEAPPTRPATAAPAAPPCPIHPAACALAARLADWLAAGDTASIAATTRIESVECPGGRAMEPGGAFPLCDEAAAGERRSGILIGRRYSEGAVVGVPEYEWILGQLLEAADLTAADAYGPGGFQVYSVSCLDTEAEPARCPIFTIIFSAILKPALIPPLGTLPGREVLVFFAEASDADPIIRETWTGSMMPDEAPVILREGGTLFDLGRIFPYRTP